MAVGGPLSRGLLSEIDTLLLPVKSICIFKSLFSFPVFQTVRLFWAYEVCHGNAWRNTLLKEQRRKIEYESNQK